MKSAVLVFPGSNCDRDLAVSLEQATGSKPAMVWHKETELPEGVDLVAVPGGFSFGDYLRCGAIAARSPIMAAVRAHAERGGLVLGICNGWQVLIESGLLEGALLRNAGLDFVCKDVLLRVETACDFTAGYAVGDLLRIPVAHHDGNFFAPEATLDRIEAEDRVAFRYVDATGAPSPEGNPNGSARNIAGMLSPNRRVLGMMPHPERLADAALGGSDGAGLFRGLVDRIAAAA